jgi:antitoxin MazE
MKTRLVQIGNSKGIRIPQPLLQQVGLEGELEIRAEANSLVIQSARKAREGWAESFAEMAERGDDILFDDVPSLSTWDDREWQW